MVKDEPIWLQQDQES